MSSQILIAMDDLETAVRFNATTGGRLHAKTLVGFYFVHGVEGDSIRYLSGVRVFGRVSRIQHTTASLLPLTVPQVSRDIRRVVCRSNAVPTWDISLAEGSV